MSRRFEVYVRELGLPGGDVEALRAEGGGIVALTMLEPKRWLVSMRGVNAPELALAIATLMAKATDMDPTMPERLEEIFQRDIARPGTGIPVTAEIIDRSRQ